MKRSPKEREETSANEETSRELISKVYKQFMQLYVKKKKKEIKPTNNSIK